MRVLLQINEKDDDTIRFGWDIKDARKRLIDEVGNDSILKKIKKCEICGISSNR